MKRTIWIGLALALCLALLAWRDGSRQASAKSPYGDSGPAASTSSLFATSSSVAVPFRLVNRHIMLDVSVNGSRPLSFVLDTGAKFAAIDVDRGRELGLKFGRAIQVGGAGAQMREGAFISDASFTVGGLPGFTQPLPMAIPFRQLAPRLGDDFDGVLGGDFLSQFVVEVDYAAQKLTLHRRDTFEYRGTGLTLPIEFRQGHPILEAEVTPIGGKPLPGKFVLDIGAGGTLSLYAPFVRKNKLPGPQTKTIVGPPAGGVGGEVRGNLGRIASLRIGKFAFSNPITFFAADSLGAFADDELQGNIGYGIASRFKLIFDYGRERLILEPAAGFDAPFERAFSGLGLSAEGADYRTFKVTRVLAGTPGEEAGLQVGDVISSVDGRAAADLTLTELLTLFETARTYELTVQRGDATIPVSITTRVLI